MKIEIVRGGPGGLYFATPDQTLVVKVVEAVEAVEARLMADREIDDYFPASPRVRYEAHSRLPCSSGRTRR